MKGVFKYNSIIIILLQIMLSLGFSAYGKVIVLVPGYFNSKVPGFHEKDKYNPYWSLDIVNVYRNAGHDVYPVNNLNPVGTIEENGALLLKFINKISSKIDRKEGFTVIAHSAGGLYTIEANNLQSLPIRKMISINTPFDGLEFVENLTQAHPELMRDLEKELNMESLNQLRPGLVRKFISNLKNRPQFPIVGVVGTQDMNLSGWDDAAYLNPIFYITQAYMSSPSDGIVTHQSSLAKTNRAIRVTTYNQFIPLDHLEQVLDADYFEYIGMKNSSYIRQEQIRFYKRLIPEL